MSASTFAQLRETYPTAELTAHLLTIHGDMFVVQAMVRVDGTVQATAMGSASILEEAEDRAYQRVFRHLGLSLEATNGLIKTPVKPAAEATQRPVATQNSAVIQSPPTVVEASMPVPTIPASPPAPPTQPSVPLPIKLLSIQDQVAEIANSNLIAESSDSPVNTEKSADSPIFPAPPVDLSDIIAQTDVELQRLGWSVNQGREFLEKTYGRRSRHDLSDEELLEFLLYLENLPTSAS